MKTLKINEEQWSKIGEVSGWLAKLAEIDVNIDSLWMESVENNLHTSIDDVEVYVERWTDPGDYPSGAGGGPMMPYYYKVIDGERVLVSEVPLLITIQYLKRYAGLNTDFPEVDNSLSLTDDQKRDIMSLLEKDLNTWLKDSHKVSQLAKENLDLENDDGIRFEEPTYGQLISVSILDSSVKIEDRITYQ